jgi:transcriptional regulator with XRE-family HTH domain
MSKQLHERLRQAREQRGLTLAAIARDCGVRESNLVLIEQNAFERLPTGLYGRTAVRSYAVAVGVCPDDALAEVADRLREPEDPIEGLARVRGIPHTPRRATEIAPRVSRPALSNLPWRPQVAAIIDIAILLGIDLVLLQLTALVAGVGAGEVLRAAAPSMVLLFGLIATTYFVLLGGIRRATIGARLAQAPAYDHMLDGADAHAVIQRSLQYALAEGASLANWILVDRDSRQSTVFSRQSS